MHGNFHSRFRFATLGMSVTVLFVVYQMLTGWTGSRDHAIMISFVVLCPPSLLVPVVDAEVGTRAFYFLWAFIGLLNAVLYATISALVSRRKKSLDSN